MNKRNSIILGLLFGILVLEIIVLAPGDLGLSPSEDLPPPPPSKSESATGQLMQDVHLVDARDGKKEWELWARRAMRPNDGDIWKLEQVKVKFFAENGVLYIVTGKDGTVAVEKNDIRISGDVVTRSSNGYIFKTPLMDYRSEARLLTCPEAVHMTGPKDTQGDQLLLSGVDMLANLNSNEIFIQKDVNARRKIRDEKVAKIKSDRAQFSGKSNSANFIGHVVIDVESMRITGPEAEFEYKPGSDLVESMSVHGGVKVTDFDKWATSERVKVFFAEDKFVFRGAPRVVQSGDELRGDEIVFLSGGRQVLVSNARAEVDPKNVENMEKKD